MTLQEALNLILSQINQDKQIEDLESAESESKLHLTFHNEVSVFPKQQSCVMFQNASTDDIIISLVGKNSGAYSNAAKGCGFYNANYLCPNIYWGNMIVNCDGGSVTATNVKCSFGYRRFTDDQGNQLMGLACPTNDSNYGYPTFMYNTNNTVHGVQFDLGTIKQVNFGRYSGSYSSPGAALRMKGGILVWNVVNNQYEIYEHDVSQNCGAPSSDFGSYIMNVKCCIHINVPVNCILVGYWNDCTYTTYS